MIWVIMGVFIGLCVFSVVNYEEILEIFSVSGIVISAVAAILLIAFVVNDRTIDGKIEMYTEENTKIETSISEVVKQYMKFESDTLIELKSDSVINLVSLYPELKSDELVKTQIEVYQANNEKIKELREEKININNYKWWLYFGG